MRAWELWAVVVTLLVLASMLSGDLAATMSDQERVAPVMTGFVPEMTNQTTQADFRSGKVTNTDVNGVPGSITLSSIRQGAKVYALVGGNSRSFYRYDTSTNAWSAAASVPARVGDGSSTSFDGSHYIYALQGSAGRNLYRYDIITNAWTSVSQTPAAIGSGGDLAWDGSRLIVLQGSTGRSIWGFDPTTATWSTLTATPLQVGAGASMMYENGALYLTRGGSTGTFWRFTLATEQWTTLASPGNVAAGGNLAGGPGDVLFATAGGNNRRADSYDPTRNAWTARTAVPQTVRAGGCLAYDGGDILYSTVGGGQNRFYTYSASSNAWTARTNLPAGVTTGGSAVYVPALSLYFSTGTFTSPTVDLGRGAVLLQVFWDAGLPPSTSVTMEVRASNTLSGGAPTGAWTTLGSESSSPPLHLSGRYVQWRATLAGDTTVAPQLQEVRLYHYHP